MRESRDTLPRLFLLAVVTITAALLWTGLPRLGNVAWVWDNVEFERYAQTLDSSGHLPTRAASYEFSLPPGMPALAVGLERAARWIGPLDIRPVGGLPRPWRAVLWTALVMAAGWLVLAGRGRRRGAGLALAAAAAIMGALDVLSAATSVDWVPGLLPQIGSVLGLLVVAALLAREVWPDWPWAPPLAALGMALLPVVFRIGLVFHPDPLFALFVGAALLVCLRAARRGWTLRAGAATGVLLGLGALTRQSAAIAMVGVALISLLLGGRQTQRYLAAAAAAVVLVAGPWWGYQASRYGNPIESNLNRPGLMLDHEPLSFLVEVPGAIVTNPWSVLDRNELFPKFHVGLWSDWTGIGDFAPPQGANAKALASSQSVLGLGGDALVLGGLALLGLPALVRAARRREQREDHRRLAALAAFFLVVWAAYVAMLLRFPQRDADPNSPHYLVFLAPVAVLLGLGAARGLWSRAAWGRLAVAGWAALYTVSWAWVLTVMV